MKRNKNGDRVWNGSERGQAGSGEGHTEEWDWLQKALDQDSISWHFVTILYSTDKTLFPVNRSARADVSCICLFIHCPSIQQIFGNVCFVSGIIFSYYASTTYPLSQPTPTHALLYKLSIYTLYSMASHTLVIQIGWRTKFKPILQLY